MAMNDQIQRRMKTAFKLGIIVTVIGVFLRAAAPQLSWAPIGDSAWQKNEQTYQMWTDVSLVTIGFGLAVLVVTLNRWLQFDGSQFEETDPTT